MVSSIASAGNSYPMQAVNTRNVANYAVPPELADKIVVLKPSGIKASAPLLAMGPETMELFMAANKDVAASASSIPPMELEAVLKPPPGESSEDVFARFLTPLESARSDGGDQTDAARERTVDMREAARSRGQLK